LLVVIIINIVELNIAIMKGQQDLKNNANAQGKSTADRVFTNHNDAQKQKGISNAGGQRSDQTSSRDSAHHPEKKKS
jgi:hypothetical protein